LSSSEAFSSLNSLVSFLKKDIFTARKNK
jgi:hypothetical protein